MEDHKSLLECLPKEVLYYYLARYLDLRDLGVLLFTSKHINGLFQTDLALQKIICDATPMRITHKTKARPIRMLYYEKIASMALKDNDASIMKYSLENLSADHIIARLRPKQDFVITKKQKFDLLTHIISHDADKVLEFLIKECEKPDTPVSTKKGNQTPKATWSTIEGAIETPPYAPHGVKMKYDGKDVELTPEQEEMASYIAGLLDTSYISNPQFIKNFFADWLKVLNPPGSTTPHVIQKYELCDFKPIAKHLKDTEERKKAKNYNYVAIEKLFNFLVDDCFTNQPENCTHQKVVAVVLKFINKHRRVLLRALLQRISSEPKSIRVLQLMLKYSKFFKEYSIDINEPIEVKRDYLSEKSQVFEATPLEAAAFYGLKNVFYTFKEHKAIVDMKRPYLPLLCINNSSEKEFFDFLVKLGADLNVFLPESLAPKTTILGYLSTRFDPSYTRTKKIENLLLKGAKLSAEEAEQFLNDQDLFLRCVASAQLDHYDPNTRTETLTFDNRAATRTFRSISSRSNLQLMSDGSFQYYIDGYKSDRVGQWKQISNIGRIWLTSDKEKRYQNWGSYGQGYVDVPVTLAKYEFLVYRNFLNEIAVVLLGPNGEFDCANVFLEH